MRRANTSELSFIKFFVYSLGFILMGSAIFLITVVYKKISFETSQVMNKPVCVNKTLELKGRVLEISMESQNKIKVFLKDEHGANLIEIYDECTGELINTIKIADQTMKSSKIDDEQITNDRQSVS